MPGNTALYKLGSVMFQEYPFETHDVTRDTSSDYAPKDIMEAARPREWTGEGDEKLRFLCTLFPERFGGLNELTLLQQQRMQNQPWPLTRGDGTAMGYFFIERIMEHDTIINFQGVGRVKELEIYLTRSPFSTNNSSIIKMQYYDIQATDSTPATVINPTTPGAVDSSGVNLFSTNSPPPNSSLGG